MRFPPTNPDFAPFVQRIKDAKPDVVFIFVPAGTQATAMIKAMQDLGLREAGINVVAPQDLLPDEELPRMGDTPLGLITSGTYSADAKRPANEAFIAAWKREYGDKSIPDFFLVDAWDGMAAIYRLVKEIKGNFTAYRQWLPLPLEGPGQPARADHDRSGNPRHRAECLHQARRKAGRQAGQCRDRDDPDGQGPWKELNPAK